MCGMFKLITYYAIEYTILICDLHNSICLLTKIYMYNIGMSNDQLMDSMDRFDSFFLLFLKLEFRLINTLQ